MAEQSYYSEALLQELLAKYPDLLAGDQMNSGAPRRWLLISREAGLPSQEGGANRWSVDHLFFDQDAIPTLVEVKRSSDTRIRREVVGQMLDYAANAVVYWPIEKIRTQFETNCEVRGQDVNQVFMEFLDTETDQEQFWQQAKTNLQAGRVRMVFVADEIPTELQRIVEFLNVQMNPAEVLAVEIKQYVGQGLKSLVPRVIGQTAEAQQMKSGVGRFERDYTKYDLTVNSSNYTGLSKRELAYRVAREAINRGATPEQLQHAITWKRNNLWWVVDEKVDQQQFIERATMLSGESGRTFDSKRFFISDDKLIHFNEKTYAFTNQWGKRTLEAIDIIIREIKATDISYQPTI